MRIHLPSFAVSFTAVCALILLGLSAWTRISSSFGGEFMNAFQSVHPNPYGANNTDLTMIEQIMGTAFDFFYAAMDALIFSISFGSLYNLILGKTQKKESE